MSKLRIERGASKIRRASLKATIDGAVADDLELMCQWSENESSYLVNLLLGFAIGQSEEFQKYKAEQSAITRPGSKDTKAASDPARKVVSPTSSVPAQSEKGVIA